jgi:hypothetical protein
MNWSVPVRTSERDPHGAVPSSLIFKAFNCCEFLI